MCFFESTHFSIYKSNTCFPRILNRDCSAFPTHISNTGYILLFSLHIRTENFPRIYTATLSRSVALYTHTHTHTHINIYIHGMRSHFTYCEKHLLRQRKYRSVPAIFIYDTSETQHMSSYARTCKYQPRAQNKFLVFFLYAYHVVHWRQWM